MPILNIVKYVVFRVCKQVVNFDLNTSKIQLKFLLKY